MTANFMTFADVVERERYDLWVGDEGWDLDYYLHENPDLKRAPYVFLTDFIGVLPMREDRSSTEFIRCWEKNAENIDHLRLHPDVRDLSILVGDEDDVLDREFGPDLPNMRQWAREHFRFSGYTYHFDPAAFRDRAALRHRLGYREDERVILASVGGTRVGRGLLEKCAEAFSLIASQIPEARMVLVGGPRAELGPSPHPRVEIRSFVPDLFEHHAAADLAIVQGGLTTTMELAAVRTPFLYFPLRHHFEQQLHVARRLDRLGAGVRLDYDRTAPRLSAPRSSSTWASRCTPRRCRSTAPTAPRASSRSCSRRSGMRAPEPDREGYVESHGTPDLLGGARRPVSAPSCFMPPWQIVHSRIFKMQVPYFARHFRVITFDPPGNGRSERPSAGYDHGTAVAHALAVLDATGTSSAPRCSAGPAVPGAA